MEIKFENMILRDMRESDIEDYVLPDDVCRRRLEIEQNGRHIGWVSSCLIDESALCAFMNYQRPPQFGVAVSYG